MRKHSFVSHFSSLALALAGDSPGDSAKYIRLCPLIYNKKEHRIHSLPISVLKRKRHLKVNDLLSMEVKQAWYVNGVNEETESHDA